MARAKIAAAIILMTLSSISMGWAQGMGGGMGRQVPHLLGDFKPVVGSGAEYQMTTQKGTMDFSYVIVGKEDVGGSPGYWMEIRSKGSELPGETVMKQLMVLDGAKPQIKRMIMQSAGRPPMEFPLAMMPGMAQRAEGGGDHSPGIKVGSETITVPAGTFECDHFRKQESRGTLDIWISSKVSPYGTVKMTNGEVTMVLEKVLSNETSHIQGQPQQMNFQMPHP